MGAGPATASENLQEPMHTATIADFANADGGELGPSLNAGKMRSLRSSSALAVNFFDYWRYRDLSPLAGALGIPGDYVDLRFEQKLPTGLKGKRPNIDVVLYQRFGPPIGIECKFCEPYDANEPHPRLDDAYLPAQQMRWSELGMPNAEGVARDLGSTFRPVHLHVGQLLKHLLGLGHTFVHHRPVQLMYLWYDDGSDASQTHRAELDEFAERLKGEVLFRPQTYQDTFARLEEDSRVDSRYLIWLRDRYFQDS